MQTDKDRQRKTKTDKNRQKRQRQTKTNKDKQRRTKTDKNIQRQTKTDKTDKDRPDKNTHALSEDTQVHELQKTYLLNRY